jgi:hypothetical protein
MSPEDEKEADAQMELIENAFRTLSEHFDTVSIFATSRTTEGPSSGPEEVGIGTHDMVKLGNGF